MICSLTWFVHEKTCYSHKKERNIKLTCEKNISYSHKKIHTTLKWWTNHKTLQWERTCFIHMRKKLSKKVKVLQSCWYKHFTRLQEYFLTTRAFSISSPVHCIFNNYCWFKSSCIVKSLNQWNGEKSFHFYESTKLNGRHSCAIFRIYLLKWDSDHSNSWWICQPFLLSFKGIFIQARSFTMIL